MLVHFKSYLFHLLAAGVGLSFLVFGHLLVLISCASGISGPCLCWPGLRCYGELRFA